MALWKMFICSQSRRDFYPQFPRSMLGTSGTMNPLLADTHEKKKNKKKKKKRKETLALLEYSLLKQARLTGNL